jgi:hypothetical protein
MQYLENINKTDHLFLTNIYEPNDNSLLLQVKGSVTAEQETDVYVTAEKSIRARAVSIDENAPYYEIYFKHYVSYHVLNESYAGFSEKNLPDLIGFGRIRVFTTSGYMDYILKETFANQIFPGELKHYAVYTEDHVVHVISPYDPVIEMEMPKI